MDAKEAVSVAKSYFEEVFGDKPTLEEIWFDDRVDQWCVTLGHRRRLVREQEQSAFRPFQPDPVREAIDYKVVRVSNKTGSVESVRLREGERAA